MADVRLVDGAAAPDAQALASPDALTRRAAVDAELAAVRRPLDRAALVDAVWRATWPHDRIVFGSSRLVRVADQVLGGKKVLVGKIANVDGNKMQFLWNGSKAGFNADQAKALFFDGGELVMKFQVKMIKKSFFEITATGAGVEPAGDDDTVRVTAKYSKISDADREALGQFANDMAFLKTQLPGK